MVSSRSSADTGNPNLYGNHSGQSPSRNPIRRGRPLWPRLVIGPEEGFGPANGEASGLRHGEQVAGDPGGQGNREWTQRTPEETPGTPQGREDRDDHRGTQGPPGAVRGRIYRDGACGVGTKGRGRGGWGDERRSCARHGGRIDQHVRKALRKEVRQEPGRAGA